MSGCVIEASNWSRCVVNVNIAPMLYCSSGSRGGLKDLHFGFSSVPLDLSDAVGHVLAQHLPLGDHHNLALGYPASQKR